MELVCVDLSLEQMFGTCIKLTVIRNCVRNSCIWGLKLLNTFPIFCYDCLNSESNHFIHQFRCLCCCKTQSNSDTYQDCWAFFFVLFYWQPPFHDCWAIDNVVIVNTADPPQALHENFDPVDPGDWIFFPGARVDVSLEDSQSQGSYWAAEGGNWTYLMPLHHKWRNKPAVSITALGACNKCRVWFTRVVKWGQ